MVEGNTKGIETYVNAECIGRWIYDRSDGKKWYSRSIVFGVLSHVLRGVGVAALWIVALTSFTYSGYHIQMRRIVTDLKLNTPASSGPLSIAEWTAALSSVRVSCPSATLTTMGDAWGDLKLGDDVNFSPFDAAKAYADINTKTITWDKIHTNSQFSTFLEWGLLVCMVYASIFTVAYLIFFAISLLATRHDGDKAKEKQEKQDLKRRCWDRLVGCSEYPMFIGHLFYALSGILIAVIVFVYVLVAIDTMENHTKIAVAYDKICAVDNTYSCFNGAPPICTELKAKTWLGQTAVANIDIIKFGGNAFEVVDECAGYACPTNKDENVVMGNSDYAVKMGSLGRVFDYSFNSMRGTLWFTIVASWGYIGMFGVDALITALLVFLVVVVPEWNKMFQRKEKGAADGSFEDMKYMLSFTWASERPFAFFGKILCCIPRTVCNICRPKPATGGDAIERKSLLHVDKKKPKAKLLEFQPREIRINVL